MSRKACATATTTSGCAPTGADGLVGITGYAADELGDVVFVELPHRGPDPDSRGETFGVIESVKTASDLYCTGGGRGRRGQRRRSPARRSWSTASPTADGWIIRLRLDRPIRGGAAPRRRRLPRAHRRLTGMAYQPHTVGDRGRMLAALGIDVGRRAVRGHPGLGPGHRASTCRSPSRSWSLQRRMAALAARNRVDLASFLGAGVYHHHLPAAVDTILRRGEFATAYTPYQPEISQGTLQTIYEYQSLLAELTGLPVVSASHYDGATATAEAALMAIRATGRDRVLASRAIHRHYLDTTRTYLGHDGHHAGGAAHPAGRHDRPGGPRGGAGRRASTGRGRAARASRTRSASWSPWRAAADLAHAAGALFVAVVEPVSLAVLASPGESARTSRPGRASRWASRPSTADPTWASSRRPRRSPARSRAARGPHHGRRRPARLRHDAARA